MIALLDQDDVWLADKLEKQVEILRSHPCVGVVHSSYYLIDKNGKRTGVKRLQGGEWKPLPDLLLEVPVSSCTTLFPMRIVEEVGLFDPESELFPIASTVGIHHALHAIPEPIDFLGFENA